MSKPLASPLSSRNTLSLPPIAWDGVIGGNRGNCRLTADGSHTRVFTSLCISQQPHSYVVNWTTTKLRIIGCNAHADLLGSENINRLTMQQARQGEHDPLPLKRKASDPNESKPMPTSRVKACTCCRQVKVCFPSAYFLSSMLSQYH